MKTYFVGFLSLIILLIFIVRIENLPAFIDIPSLLIVLGLSLAGIYASFDFKTISDSGGVIFGRISLKSEMEFEKHIRLWELASRYALGAGGVGTLLALIIMLGNMSDVESIGPNMAVALLSALYGIIISEFVFQPLKGIVIEKLEDSDIIQTKDHTKRSFANWMVIILAGFFPIMSFFILIISMSTINTNSSNYETDSLNVLKDSLQQEMIDKNSSTHMD